MGSRHFNIWMAVVVDLACEEIGVSREDKFWEDPRFYAWYHQGVSPRQAIDRVWAMVQMGAA